MDVKTILNCMENEDYHIIFTTSDIKNGWKDLQECGKFWISHLEQRISTGKVFGNLWSGKVYFDMQLQVALAIRGFAIRGFDYSRTQNEGKLPFLA